MVMREGQIKNMRSGRPASSFVAQIAVRLTFIEPRRGVDRPTGLFVAVDQILDWELGLRVICAGPLPVDRLRARRSAVRHGHASSRSARSCRSPARPGPRLGSASSVNASSSHGGDARRPAYSRSTVYLSLTTGSLLASSDLSSSFVSSTSAGRANSIGSSTVHSTGTALADELLFPSCPARLPSAGRAAASCAGRRLQLLRQLLQLLLLIGRGDGQVGSSALFSTANRPIKIFLRNRIELVVMAAGTADRQPQVDRARRGDAIDHRLDAEFLGVGSPFFIQQRVAMKPGRHELIDRRVGQQVAGELLDRELIERQVAIVRVDHPIAILPDRPRVVVGVAVAVGVASQVEPVPAPALAVVGRGQQAIDQSLVGVGTLVRQECVDLGDCWRQPEQIQASARRIRRHAVRLGRRLDGFSLQPGQDKRIDRIANSIGVADLRNRRTGDRLKRPVVALDLSGALGRQIVGRGFGAGVDPRAIVAICCPWSASRPSGGMASHVVVAAAGSALISRLSALLPGSIAAPLFPPSIAAATVSIRRPDFARPGRGIYSSVWPGPLSRRVRSRPQARRLRLPTRAQSGPTGRGKQQVASDWLGH